LRVGGEQRDPLGKRLSQQDAIERILVQVRQGVDGARVLAGDGQLGVATIEKPAAGSSK
jgi:hypothetical protein